MKEITHPSPVKGAIPAKYAGKWIAILRRRIIDSDDDFDRLFERLDKQGIAEDVMFMGVPRPGVLVV